MNERKDMDTGKQHCQTETHTKARTKMGSETATVFTGALDFIYELLSLNIRWKQNMTFLSAHTLSNAKSQQEMTLGVYNSRDLETLLWRVSIENSEVKLEK